MKQQIFHNPLDAVFEVDQSYSAGEVNHYEAEYSQVPANQITDQQPPVNVKDAEDIETDNQISEIYNLAVEAYHNQTAMVEIIDPKFAARNAEVAANYLNIALNAATSKAKIKNDRKRVGQFNPAIAANKTTNNVIVASQEDILRMISIDSTKGGN